MTMFHIHYYCYLRIAIEKERKEIYCVQSDDRKGTLLEKGLTSITTIKGTGHI